MDATYKTVYKKTHHENKILTTLAVPIMSNTSSRQFKNSTAILKSNSTTNIAFEKTRTTPVEGSTNAITSTTLTAITEGEKSKVPNVANQTIIGMKRNETTNGNNDSDDESDEDDDDINQSADESKQKVIQDSGDDEKDIARVSFCSKNHSHQSFVIFFIILVGGC